MSESSTESSTSETAAETPAQEQPTEKPDADQTDWKAEARKWEQRAKENKTAAERLAELEESQKTESQKLAERAEAAERELEQTRTTALRAEIALDKGLTQSQAKRLVGSTREELEADADELLRDLGEAAQPRRPKPDPTQGRDTRGSSSTADQFAGAVRDLL
jgi:hypothetical protein